MIKPNPGDHIVLDLETFDPYLTTEGTDAFPRRHGSFVFLCGVLHPATGEEMILPWDANTRALIREWLDIGLVWWGANLKYDLNWLLSEGVMVPAHTHRNTFKDILLYAPLLDETRPPGFYSLNSQAEHYGLPGKPITQLMEAAINMGLKVTEKSVRGQLHKLPRDVVIDYLRYDIRTTWAVAERQMPLLEEKKLTKRWYDAPYSLVELEDKLLPVLAMIEQQGVRVDIEAAERLHDAAYKHIDDIKERLRQANNGHEVNLNPSGSLTSFLIDRGHKLPETPSSTEEKPRYSTAEIVMNELAEKDPLVADIVIARKAEKIAKDFCKGAIIESHHNGRIHANINQIIGRKEGSNDSRGVRFGRLSYSMPNLQQVPKRDKVGFDDTGGLGTAMRGIFIAEEDCQLMSADFSSQEPRWIIHWAETWNVRGASRIGDMYREDPSISSHDIVAGGIEADMPYKTKRSLAKIINLGKGYEMGMAKLITNLVLAGVDPKQAQTIMDDFDRNFPHVGLASKTAMGVAERNGFVRTYMGRILQFNLWEPARGAKGIPLPYDEAMARYANAPVNRRPIKRANTYRAFNRIVQGSSADQTKLAMVILWYVHGILPTMQVHDELVDAAIDTVERALIYKNVMENCIPLTIPSLTEVKLGPSWADGKLLEVA